MRKSSSMIYLYVPLLSESILAWLYDRVDGFIKIAFQAISQCFLKRKNKNILQTLKLIGGRQLFIELSVLQLKDTQSNIEKQGQNNFPFY